jgi:hypothetical protein
VSLQDVLRASAEGFLGSGEKIQHAIPLVSRKPMILARVLRIFVIFTLIDALVDMIVRFKYVVVVTDKRILLGRRNRRGNRMTAVVQEFPRGTRIDNEHGPYLKSVGLGMKLYVSRKYADDVFAADTWQ